MKVAPALTGLSELQEYCERSFELYFDSTKVVLLLTVTRSATGFCQFAS
jgi:hypothetical protein